MKKALRNLVMIFTALLVLVAAYALGGVAYDTLKQEIAKHTGVMDIYRRETLPPYSLSQDFSNRGVTQSALVRLELAGDDNQPPRFFCSGTVISNDYVLTAAHCLMDYSGFKAKMYDKAFRVTGLPIVDGVGSLTVVGEAAALNSTADYALVKGDFRTFLKKPILAAPNALSYVQGPILMSCGFPYGAGATCNPVFMSSVHTEFFQLAAQGRLYPGMSGGPVVDTGAGAVFAVNSAVSDSEIIIAPLIGLFESLHIEVTP